MQYTDAEVSANSLIVVSDKRSKVVDYEQIYESTVDYTTYTSTTTGYDGEGQITSALAYVLSDDMPQVYITEGHDERVFSSSFLTGLSKGNVEYETINLMNYEEIPEDAACLIINAAGTDFSTDDKDKVIAYLEKGGKVIMTTRYMTTSATPNLDDILKYMGLEVVEGLVVDSNPDYYYRSPYYLLPEVMYTDYTKNVYNSYYVFAPFTQGIMVIDEAAEGMEYTTILSTSEDSFSKKNIGNADNYDKEEGDQDGPFEIAVEAVKTLDAGEATMVVYGCEEFFTDDASAMVSGANMMMFTDTVAKFVSHEVNSSVPVKSFDVSYLTVPENGVLLLAPLVTIVMPIAFLVAGFVIWFKRRKR
jgi:ABC-2 type transport system permease protein